VSAASRNGFASIQECCGALAQPAALLVGKFVHQRPMAFHGERAGCLLLHSWLCSFHGSCISQRASEVKPNALFSRLHDKLLPHLGASPMRPQPFDLCELAEGWQRLLERGAVVFHHARAALELIHRQAATARCRACAISSFAMARTWLARSVTTAMV